MDEELTYGDIFHGLIAGKQYVLKKTLQWQWKMFKNNDMRYFVPGTSDEIHMSAFGEYFAWTHYGSSANEATMDGLKFIIDTIFKADPSDFTEMSASALVDVINEGR